jgi:DNA-binding response OmpR family regulator
MLPSHLSRIRVLIVGAKGYAAVLLRNVLNANGVSRVCVVEEAQRALEVLCTEIFDVVYLEEQVELDGRPFAMAARRTAALQNPLVPIFVVSSGPRRRDVEKSRDLGVNDVIARPFSPKTLISKLTAALSAPRPFIAAPHFFGPDRRAKSHPSMPLRGTERRVRKPHKTRMPTVEI